MTKPLLVLAGPTAAGKTELAVLAAERLNGEILNADAFQVYKGMDIGTAKPEAELQQRVQFHLIDLVDPDQPYNASLWKKQALKALDDIQKKHKTPVLCGGAGMYIRSLLYNWSMSTTPQQSEVRKQLKEIANTQGSSMLHKMLEKSDPESAARIHPNDLVRLIRALEVYQTTGITQSQYFEEDKQQKHTVNSVFWGLHHEREVLYQRIEHRCLRMINQGLEEEVRNLLAKGYSPQLNSMSSVGYREMCMHLNRQITKDEAVKLIITNTRRYAKRQLTWFRAEQKICWLNMADFSSAEHAADYISQQYQDTISQCTH